MYIWPQTTKSEFWPLTCMYALIISLQNNGSQHVYFSQCSA